jgi:hypothetical protein
MKNIYIDPESYDFALDNYNLRLTTTETEYWSQKIENNVQINLGEYFLDRDKGIPYFGPNGQIMQKNPDLNLVQSLLVNEITNIDGINNVSSFVADFDRANRTYRATVQVITDTGVPVETEITL